MRVLGTSEAVADSIARDTIPRSIWCLRSSTLLALFEVLFVFGHVNIIFGHA